MGEHYLITIDASGVPHRSGMTEHLIVYHSWAVGEDDDEAADLPGLHERRHADPARQASGQDIRHSHR